MCKSNGAEKPSLLLKQLKGMVQRLWLETQNGTLTNLYHWKITELLVPSNTCWGVWHRNRSFFYFFILTCGSYSVTRRQFPLRTCIPVLSLYGGFPASSPAPLQRLKCRVWWRTPGRITAFRVNQTLTSLWFSAVFQIHLHLIILEARLEHAVCGQSREKIFGQRQAEFSHRSFLLYMLY